VAASLSNIPVEKRRQLAGTLGLFAVLFIAVGAVAATGAETALLKTVVVVGLMSAVLLAMLAWGVALSVKLDLEEMRLDSAVESAVADAVASGSPGVRNLGCGHTHDPDELHVTDDPCAHDGAGVGCTHSCDTCVLARLRPLPSVPRPAVRPRPTPAPVPSAAASPRPSPIAPAPAAVATRPRPARPARPTPSMH